MSIFPRCAASGALILIFMAGTAGAADVVGVHRWYENDSADPVISLSMHSSMDRCSEDIRIDVREQQAAWEKTREDYRFRFSTHGCFDMAGIDDGGQDHSWEPAHEIYWVNPVFVVAQCHAAGGDPALCAEVTSEFIEANRGGDAMADMQAVRPY